MKAIQILKNFADTTSENPFPGVYVPCGAKARRITAVAQQHRAISLVEALLKDGKLRRKTTSMAGQVLAGGAGVFEGRSRPFYGEDDDLFAALRPRGLPIGNLTSQVWANVYLTPFDHFVKRELRCPGYVRYVDDFRLFGDDPRELWSWRDRIAERLAVYRLRVHPRSQPRGVEEGVPFLGFRVWPARRRVKARKVHHAGRRLRLMARQVRDRELPASRLTEAVVAWVNHVSRANTIGLRKSVLRGLWGQGAGRAEERLVGHHPGG